MRVKFKKVKIMKVTGKKIIITGAAGGLGTAMVRELTGAGAEVYILDIDDDAGKALENEARKKFPQGKATYVHCDLNDLNATKEIVSSLADSSGGIDVLVNNAAIYPSKEFDEYSLEEYEKVQRVNVEAAIVCSKEVLPYMKAVGSGSIINISSITFYGGWANLMPYVVSKGGIVGLTRALAREFGPHGITVNAVSPGAFPTAAEKIHPDPEEYQKFILDHQSLKRRGAPEDIANIIMFLASDASSFITGQTINIDGGWVMK